MLGSGAVLVVAEGADLLDARDERRAVLPQRVVRQVRALPGGIEKALEMLTDAARAGEGSGGLDDNITELEETLRLTSICGLGQVALGPLVSVLGLERGGTEARPQPR